MRVLWGQKGQRIPPTESQLLSFVEHLPIQDFEPWPRHSAPENGWVGSESCQGICLLKTPLAQLGSLERLARWRVVVSFAGWSGSSGWRVEVIEGVEGCCFKWGWFCGMQLIWGSSRVDLLSWAVYDVDDQRRCWWSKEMLMIKGLVGVKRSLENNMYPLVNQSLFSGKYTI